MTGDKILEIMRKTGRSQLSDATDMVYGIVTDTNPLKIKIDNRLEISEPFIVATSIVSNFNVNIEIEGEVKQCTIRLGLRIGEKVLLLRTQRGQKYIIIDRLQ